MRTDFEAPSRPEQASDGKDSMPASPEIAHRGDSPLRSESRHCLLFGAHANRRQVVVKVSILSGFNARRSMNEQRRAPKFPSPPVLQGGGAGA